MTPSTIATLPTEWKLLLLLARRTLSDDVLHRARCLLGPSLDWSALLRHASSQGVTTLLYRGLGLCGEESVPPAVRAELKAAYQGNVARSRLLVQDLVELLDRFAAAGIPVLPLKGVSLAESLYGDVALRACVDLDVLVPRAVVGDAFRVLGAIGYEPKGDDPRDGADINWLLASNVAHAFVRARAGATWLLELHWDLVWRWRADTLATDDLWRTAEQATFWGATGYRLSAEWELIYLAVHAAHHRWSMLKWLVDIHELCLMRAIDWEKVRDLAARLGWGKALRLTLSICRSLLDTPVPGGFVDIPPPRWWSFPPPEATGLWGEALFAVRLLERPEDKLAYLGRLLLAPTLADRRLLPRASIFTPAAYGVRPLRLLARWGRPLARTTLDRLGVTGGRQ
jgi:hypothetical protein